MHTMQVCLSSESYSCLKLFIPLPSSLIPCPFSHTPPFTLPPLSFVLSFPHSPLLVQLTLLSFKPYPLSFLSHYISPLPSPSHSLSTHLTPLICFHVLPIRSISFWSPLTLLSAPSHSPSLSSHCSVPPSLTPLPSLYFPHLCSPSLSFFSGLGRGGVKFLI